MIQEADGLRWTTEGIDSYLAYANHEPGLMEHLQIDPDGCFIDIGSHVGRYAIRMSKKCKKVIAIEPVDETVQLLYRNLELNGIKNVNVYSYAITNFIGERVQLYTTNQPGHTSINRQNDNSVVKTYAGRTLDSILEKYIEEPNLYFTEFLIKVDVEGAELGVLKSAEDIIKHLKPTWVIEVHQNPGVEAVTNFLLEKGYAVREIMRYNPCIYLKAEWGR